MPKRLDEEELAEWRAGRDAGLSARRADDRRGARGRRRTGEQLLRTDYVSDSFIQNTT